VAQVSDGGEGGGLEHEADAVLGSGGGAGEGGDFVGFVGEGPGHGGAVSAGDEVGGDDAFEDEVLEDGDVELAPGGGLVLDVGVGALAFGEGGEGVFGMGFED